MIVSKRSYAFIVLGSEFLQLVWEVRIVEISINRVLAVQGVKVLKMESDMGMERRFHLFFSGLGTFFL